MDLLELLRLGLLGRELALERALGLLQLAQELGRDRQQVAAGELGDLADVAEAGTHDLGGIAELLEVVVDLRDRMDARVIGRRDALEALLLEIPVVDAADERGDQRDAGLGAGDGLGEAEEQRQVAVDAFLLELLGGADALPGGGDLDEDALAVDAVGLIKADQPAGLLDGALGVEREPGIDLGRDAARDDLEDLLAEGDEQAIDAGFDLGVEVVALALGRADDVFEQPADNRASGPP